MVKDGTLTSKDRREHEKLATRAKILDAAREMFTEEGFDATTMRAIADRIGYTATAIYYHFKDKDALLLELCLLDFRALGHALAAAGKIVDPVERLRSIGLAYIDFGLNNPSQYRFMFMTVGRAVNVPHGGLDASNPEEDAYTFMIMTVQEGMEQKRFRAEFTSPEQIGNVLWAAVHGVVSLWIAKSQYEWVNFGDIRELGRKTVDSILRGIMA